MSETMYLTDKMIKPLHIVFNHDKHHPIYHIQIIRFLNKIYSNYERYKDGIVLDYCDNCMASMYGKVCGYKTLYVCSDRNYEKTIRAYKITNNTEFDYITNWREVNSLIKKKRVILQVIDNLDHALISKRLIGNEKVDNILILLKKGVDFRQFKEIERYLHLHGYEGYYVKNTTIHPIKRTTLSIKECRAIAFIHKNSRYRSDFKVYFD